MRAVKEWLFRGDDLEHERSRREDFDPIAEGQRYDLASDVSAAIWDHVRREATNREGLCDEDLARERFTTLAKRIAERGGQLGPAVGKWTQVDAASSAASVGNVLTASAPHKTTLVLTREGLARVGLNRDPDRTTPRGLERVTPEESLGFLRSAMGAC